MTRDKKVIIIAGPNGAGKTTFAREFLPAEAGLPVFVNADLIAAGLSPFHPELAAIRAGRLMLQQIDAMPRRDGASPSSDPGRTVVMSGGSVRGVAMATSSS